MNKKTVISAIDHRIVKLKVLAKKKESIRGRLAMTAKEKESVRGKLAVTAKKLAVTAKEKESVRNRLVVTAKKLATTAMEKEEVRRKLAVTAKQLATTAEQLATTAKEKEDVRRQLAVTAESLRLQAEQLAVTATEREDVRRKLAVTAENLRLQAEQLAITAKEKEEVRRNLAVAAEQLATTAKEKEEVRRNLAVAAEQLATTAKEIESANKELHSLDLAKDEFVSIASHQLRTPLTAIKGYVGMLLDGDPGPINDKQREYLGEMRRANNRMIDLITALLNVSRVDLGAFSVEPEPVNMEEIARGVLKEMEIKIKDKKFRVETSFEKGLPLLSADPKIIRMIFQNLLSNAVKYTPSEGTISLDIKKDGSFILISVADTGYGIPESVQTKIFTKMFRADNARAKDPDGTGLGLYIIRATIEQIGGKIWFKSTENKGTTFYTSIPLEGMKKRESDKSLQ